MKRMFVIYVLALITLLIFVGNSFCLDDCYNQNYQRQDWLKTARWNTIEDMEKSGKDFRNLEKRWPTVNLRLSPEEEQARFGITGLELAQKAYLARHFDGTTMRMFVYLNIGHASGERKLANYRMENNPAMDVKYLDPDFPEDKKEGRDWFMMLHWTKPSDARGQSILIHSYNDKDRDCDTWIWFPSLRKSRRLTPSNGGDSVAGSDWTFSDGFLLRITDEVHQIIGETRVNGFVPIDYYEGLDVLNKYGPNTKEYVEYYRQVLAQPRDCWVVRAKSKLGGYGDWYDTRIVLIDKEFGCDYLWETYAPKGRMMRTYELKWRRQSDYNGKPVLSWTSFCEVLNFEDRGWTYWCAPQTNFGCPVPESWGSLRELKKSIPSTVIPYMAILPPKKLAPLEELYSPAMIEARKKFYPVRLETWPDQTKIIGLYKH